jgi:hypothetical protein
MDRKALIREYKETKRPMGVYRVWNTASGRTLIGTSIDLPAILNRHRAQLRMGVHDNRSLQKDWNEAGPDVFAFEELDRLDPPDEPGYDPSSDLKQLEQLWREKLAPLDIYR